MRIQKTIKIDGREITVKELRISDCIGLYGRLDAISSKALAESLPLAVDLSLDDLKVMAPSEIMQIFGAFKEVNSVMFEWAKFSGMDRLLGNIGKALITDFSSDISDILKRQAAGQDVMAGNTDQ